MQSFIRSKHKSQHVKRNNVLSAKKTAFHDSIRRELLYRKFCDLRRAFHSSLQISWSVAAGSSSQSIQRPVQVRNQYLEHQTGFSFQNYVQDLRKTIPAQYNRPIIQKILKIVIEFSQLNLIIHMEEKSRNHPKFRKISSRKVEAFVLLLLNIDSWAEEEHQYCQKEAQNDSLSSPSILDLSAIYTSRTRRFYIQLRELSLLIFYQKMLDSLSVSPMLNDNKGQNNILPFVSSTLLKWSFLYLCHWEKKESSWGQEEELQLIVNQLHSDYLIKLSSFLPVSLTIALLREDQQNLDSVLAELVSQSKMNLEKCEQISRSFVSSMSLFYYLQTAERGKHQDLLMKLLDICAKKHSEELRFIQKQELKLASYQLQKLNISCSKQTTFKEDRVYLTGQSLEQGLQDSFTEQTGGELTKKLLISRYTHQEQGKQTKMLEIAKRKLLAEDQQKKLMAMQKQISNLENTGLGKS